MNRRTFSLRLLSLLPLLCVLPAWSQQPVPKPPVLPAINPALAKLDQTIEGLDGPGFAIAYSEETQVLAAACENGAIQLWNKDVLFGIRSGSKPANELRGHTGAVTALAWSGGPILASAGRDNKLLLWNVVDGMPVHTQPTPYLVKALAMAHDGKLVACAGEGNVVLLWDTATGKIAAELKHHKDWVFSVAFSPDGKLLVSGGQEGDAVLWEVPSGKQLRILPAPPTPAPKPAPDPVVISQVAFSPDGKTIALGRWDGTIDLVNTDNGAKLRTLTGHTSSVTGLVFHPLGQLLASVSKDRTVKLWTPASGALIKSLEGHNAWIEGAVLVSQGTRIATVSADRTVRLWDMSDPTKK